MTYQLTKDIDEHTFNVAALNTELTRINNRVIFTIDGAKALDEDLRLTLRFLLKTFQTTHTSILAVLRYQNEEKFDTNGSAEPVTMFGPDAMSLVREQIEKVFMITLLCHEPEKWSKAYLRDDWRRLYEHLLHQREETEPFERFKEYNEDIAPDILEKMRTEHDITTKEKEATEYRFSHPADELPSELKGHTIPTFPTPGTILKTHLKDTPCVGFLSRLYKEYKFISGYTHAGHLKLQMLMMSDRLFTKNISRSLRERYYDTMILRPAVITSFVANVMACTEMLTLIRPDLEVVAELVKHWEELKKGSHLAIALWDLRGKDFLAYGRIGE